MQARARQLLYLLPVSLYCTQSPCARLLWISMGEVARFRNPPSIHCPFLYRASIDGMALAYFVLFPSLCHLSFLRSFLRSDG
ncbi:hypothetical protein B0H65DRAFT_457961 [Neurospora tetraspora]|uniref:Uncharacterized protein n=1 Tax=Neurospora tetraspora TaxID=94610 RepID=A0AAE0MVX2_9PEZI|nr:hypothetical protein B0H65DRAFT_457961 [Neurospora tetraspora]